MSDGPEPPKPSDRPDLFRALVLEALQAYRRLTLGELRPPTGIELHDSPLAHIPAVRALCWAEKPSRAQLTAAMKSLPEWAVEQLRPSETADPRSPAALRYRAITAHYLRGESWAKFNQDNEIEDHSRLRASGLDAVREAIAAVIANPDELEGLPRKALDNRLAGLDPDARRLLEFIATVNEEVSLGELEEVGGALPCGPPAAIVDELLAARLLLPGDRDDTYRVAPEARPAGVRNAVADPARRDHIGRLAARLFEHRGDYLNAARRWRDGGHYNEAAALLIENYNALVKRSQTNAMLALVNLFGREELRGPLYAELHIAAGRAATAAEQIHKARGQLEEALTVDDEPLLGCLALYYLAKAYQDTDFNMTVHQYGEALARLDALQPNEQRTLHSGKVLTVSRLRLDLLLGLGWAYIQGKERVEAAERLLLQAERALRALPAGDNLRECALHNAWAGYYKKRGNRDAEALHRRIAFTAAQDTDDMHEKIMTAHNLGQTLVYMGQYAEGLDFLNRSLSLTREAEHRRNEGMNLKAIGGVHYFTGDYLKAIEVYTEALHVFTALGNTTLQGYLHHDLAEAYGALHQVAALRYYYEMGRSLEMATNNEELGKLLDALRATHPLELGQPLDDLEVRVLQLVFDSDERRVTTGSVDKMLGMSSRSAAQKALKKMVEKGLLQMVEPEGNSRRAYYTLPNGAGSGSG